MFSHEDRCIYNCNPLADVICQLRFPEILTIGANVPVDFQEAIRDEYPQYIAKKEIPAPKVTGTPGNMTVQKQPEIINYQFSSADGIWRVNLTSKFISLTCSKYHCWEDFAGHLDKPLAAFIKIYKPAYFERVGLRYLNFISKEALDLAHKTYADLIAPCYLGPLAEDDVPDQTVTRSTVDVEMALRGGCHLKLHAGPGLVTRNGQQQKEVKFIFDQDLFMSGNIPVNMSAGAMQTLHSQAFSIFRGAITDTLHEAMEPTQL